MYNYEHEIKSPESIAMRKFLWLDYFHDSIITDVHFYPEKEVLVLKLKDTGDNNISENYYYLSFKNTVHYLLQSSNKPLIFLNGRFKNTACLQDLIKEKHCSLYHFRIQLTSGYLDIVFKDFQIRKENGRVNYSMKEYSMISHKPLDKKTVINAIHEKITDGDYTDDFELFLDLQKLYYMEDSELDKYSRICLNLSDYWEDAKIYAGYLLGKYGLESDIPNLLRIYKTCCNPLQKRTIMDSIELLTR